MGDGLESLAAESKAAGILGADSLGDTMMADVMLRSEWTRIPGLRRKPRCTVGDSR
jgi:hypothetical protein